MTCSADAWCARTNLIPVRGDAAFPAGEPPGLTPGRGRVFHAADEYFPSGAGEIAGGVCAFSGGHFFKNLEQAPTLPLIALGGKGSLALEIHVVNQGIEGVRSAVQHPVELSSNHFAVGRRGGVEHFWKGLFKPPHEEFRLNFYGGGEYPAQILHPGAVEIALEIRPRSPWAMLIRREPCGQGYSPFGHEAHEVWETLLEWPFCSRRIPDEMAYAQGRKVLAAIPRCQPLDSACALILPNAMADLCGGVWRERKLLGYRGRVIQEESGDQAARGESKSFHILCSHLVGKAQCVCGGVLA